MIPKGRHEKRRKITAIAKKYDLNLLDVTLYFVLAAEEFAAIIPGASKSEQMEANVKSLHQSIPKDFWKELKSEGLIYEKAQPPAVLN